MNKKSNIPVAWFTRDVQNVSALFSGGHWCEVSLYNWKHCNWLHVMSSNWWSWPCFKHESFY